MIDLIEDYFNADLWPSSVIPNKRKNLCRSANELVARCRAAEIPVIWVRQEFAPDFSDAFPHARAIGKRYAIKGTPGAQLLPELDVDHEDVVLTKKRFSAFYQTSLELLLIDRNVTEIILAGITTAWCVRSTAVDAYQRDYDVLLAKDCMAAFQEADHVDSMTAMDGYIGKVVTNHSLATILSNESGISTE